MLVVLSYQLWVNGRTAARFGEASLALEIPYGPFYGILALGMLLYAVVLLVELMVILRGRMADLSLPPEDMSP